MPFGDRIDYLFTLSTLNGSGRGWALQVWFAPYGLHHRSNGFRWYVLVVEPSPLFRDRGSAADHPLVHPGLFHTVTLAVSSFVVVGRALGSSSNSPSDSPVRYQTGRPSNPTSGVGVPLAVGH